MSIKPNMSGTPEQYLSAPKEIDIDTIDAINCAIGRAAATASLLSINITSKEGSKISKHYAEYALDAVCGYLNQISVLINHGGDAHEH